MRYVPYGPDLEREPNVVVDGRGTNATVLELSHWPGNTTPPELKADTSTEIVLNYLRSPKRDEYRRNAEAVSNNHFDVDGLLAIWAVLHPDAALKRAELLVAVAECADFERWPNELATQVTCALNGLESSPASEIHKALAAKRDHLERAALLYGELLPLLPGLLDDPGPFEQYWRDEYDEIQAGRELFARGEATIKEVPEVDLAIFELPRRVHNVALYEQTQRLRVVTAVDEHRYEARYRYESWVELQSRRPPPRIELRPLAELFQTFEGNAGDWIADPVDDITPRMRFRNGDDDLASSSITPGLFVRMVGTYLRDNAANERLLWSPETAMLP